MRRFIRGEDRKAMLLKREQALIDREIGTLKQQLDKIKIMIKQESHSQTLLRTKKVLTKHCDSHHDDDSKDGKAFYALDACSVEPQCSETSDVVILQTESKVDSVEVHKIDENVPFEIMLVPHEITPNASPVDKDPDHSETSAVTAECAAAFVSRISLRYAWKKWVNYVSERRMSIHAESSTLETDLKDLLAKYWHRWRACTEQSRHSNVKRPDKIINPEKIENFIKSLHEKKLQVQNCTREESYNRHRMQALPSQVKRKKWGREACSKPRDTNVYEHRLRAQKDIIAVQKAEIQTQNQLIEELRLAKLKLEVERSRAEASSGLLEARSSCDVALRARARALTCSLSVPAAPVHPSAIALRMEERRKERERRWQQIKENKRQLEEEKRKKLSEEEAERKRTEEEEKMRRIVEFRERRRIEKENELKKQRERENLQELLSRATNYYNRHLLRRYGLGGWLALMKMRKHQLDRAIAHHETKLLRKHVTTWRRFALQSAASKIEMANAHYEHRLLQLCFRFLLMAYDDRVRRNQVASDFRELKLLERAFSRWHQWTCRRHVEMAFRDARAVEHAERRLLARCVRRWRLFPAEMRELREREARKSVWRRKVQEVLPDYRPPSPT
ncbi:trichohyalin isoform X2 [Bacillus rossius redtenbacheri]|uniref:trichohyalin isoform X2 n=1 Tax=Bacillus rossius redtenbacheri TaxID=93214 RepID=UPI002FDE97A6